MTICYDDEDLVLVDNLYYKNKSYQEAEKKFYGLTKSGESSISSTFATPPLSTATSLTDASVVPSSLYPTAYSAVPQSQVDISAIELLQTWSSQINARSVGFSFSDYLLILPQQSTYNFRATDPRYFVRMLFNGIW